MGLDFFGLYEGLAVPPLKIIKRVRQQAQRAY